MRLSLSNILIFIAILLSLATFFGQNQLTFYLTFLKADIANGFLSFSSFEKTYFIDYEFWRLISPIFIHFSVAHLAFNSLWVYILGTRIENLEGFKKLILLIIFSGSLSNFAESAASGAIIFGGLSGCVYGLLGYCYIKEFIQKRFSFDTSPESQISMKDRNSELLCSIEISRYMMTSASNIFLSNKLFKSGKKKSSE